MTVLMVDSMTSISAIPSQRPDAPGTTPLIVMVNSPVTGPYLNTGPGLSLEYWPRSRGHSRRKFNIMT
jgi:hypothetical protein